MFSLILLYADVELLQTTREATESDVAMAWASTKPNLLRIDAVINAVAETFSTSVNKAEDKRADLIP